MNEEILVAIFNYNCNESANVLLGQFGKDFDTVVLDSGSPVKDDNFVILDNVYYNGMFNAGIKIMKEHKRKRFLLITSDIVIDDGNYNRIKNTLNTLSDDIGVYSSSASKESRAHSHCKNKKSDGFRDVKYAEGFFVCVKEEIIDRMYPINTDVNKLGWCTDTQFGYHASVLNLRTVVEDMTEIYHPNGTGYNNTEARREMTAYVNYLDDPGFTKFIIGCKVGLSESQLNKAKAKSIF